MSRHLGLEAGELEAGQRRMAGGVPLVLDEFFVGDAADVAACTEPCLGNGRAAISKAEARFGLRGDASPAFVGMDVRPTLARTVATLAGDAELERYRWR